MDKALKQRLVGASVLIILAVIVLPMLLSGRSDTLKQESRQIELPQKPEELSFATRRFPIGVPDKSTRPEQLDKEIPEQADPELLNQDVVVEAPDGAADTVSDGEDATEPAELVEPPGVSSVIIDPATNETGTRPESMAEPRDFPRYLVQVASFSSEKRANALAEELRAGNLTVVLDVVDRTAGRLHRVRVGPFAERSDADAVIAKIRKQNAELSPRVMDMRPDDAAPVSEPHDPMARWVVQVGSYSAAAAADAEVAKLIMAGFNAYSERVSSAQGVTYKVRVGPEIQREKAKELARRIKAEHNLDGWVITQE